MSQKPSPQRPIQPRVASGIPWWLWVLLFIVGGGIGVSLLLKSIPEDPEQLYRDALIAADGKDTAKFRENSEKLKQFPAYGRQQKILEGITLLGGSRPMKAIPVLKEAAGEENDSNQELRQTALRFLGGAYAVARDRPTAVQTFELMLKADPDSAIARQSIVSILTDIFAWEESLSHLNFLAEHKFNLPQVLNMRGDIHMELKQYKEAAEDFEGAIKANEADPLNSSKISKLVACLIQLRDFEKADSLIDEMDHPGKKAVARAEVLLSKEDLKGALSSLDMIRREAPNDPDAALTYGRIMLKYNTPERAAEGLVTLRSAVVFSPRNVVLYRLIVELAKLAGETELAALAQQNVERLDAMNVELDQKLAEVIRTRDDPEARLQVADLAHKCGRMELAYKIYSGLAEYYPDRASEITAKKEQMRNPLSQLVSTATGAASEAAESTSPTSDAEPPQ
jgi:tetratricopeptide (TPR) repeat protein